LKAEKGKGEQHEFTGSLRRFGGFTLDCQTAAGFEFHALFESTLK